MALDTYPIYTKQTDCQDCYKCVRGCPVKAIKIEDNSAKVMPEYCISCGNCIRTCPAKAKKIRKDLGRAKLLINNNIPTYASLAPSWISEFKGIDKEKLICAIRRLGFAGVSETALGAEIVSKNVQNLLNTNKPGLYISTACPSVVEYIKKYRPDLVDSLTSFYSPLLSHCKFLKQTYGENIQTVFFGPCVAKKLEADENPDLLNIALTFKDLKKWIEEENIHLDELKTSKFDTFQPIEANNGKIYPIEGGMIETIKEKETKGHLLEISGMSNIINELKDINQHNIKEPIFIEALACAGGCIKGPAMDEQSNGISSRIEILNSIEENKPIDNEIITIEKVFKKIIINKNDISDSQIKKALNSISKFSTVDELNCGGCGYKSCRDFATALATGIAEPEMCVSYIKKQAQRKANALIRCIPSAIIVVNEDLEIIEYNEKFIDMFYEENEHRDYFDRDNITGINADKFISFTNLFQSALKSGKDIRKDHIRDDDKLYDVTIFTIDENKVVGGIIQDVTNTEMKKEQIAEQAKEVINKNLSTVQQIACTLGEHMAETEILLRSIARDFSIDDDNNSHPQEVEIKTSSNKRDD